MKKLILFLLFIPLIVYSRDNIISKSDTTSFVAGFNPTDTLSVIIKGDSVKFNSSVNDIYFDKRLTVNGIIKQGEDTTSTKSELRNSIAGVVTDLSNNYYTKPQTQELVNDSADILRTNISDSLLDIKYSIKVAYTEESNSAYETTIRNDSVLYVSYTQIGLSASVGDTILFQGLDTLAAIVIKQGGEDTDFWEIFPLGKYKTIYGLDISDSKNTVWILNDNDYYQVAYKDFVTNLANYYTKPQTQALVSDSLGDYVTKDTEDTITNTKSIITAGKKALILENTGQAALDLTTNGAMTAMDIKMNGGLSAITVTTTGTSTGQTINQNGGSEALKLETTSSKALNINHQGGNSAIDIVCEGNGINIATNSITPSTIIDNSGSGSGLTITTNGNAPSMDIDNSGSGSGLILTGNSSEPSAIIANNSDGSALRLTGNSSSVTTTITNNYNNGTALGVIGGIRGAYSDYSSGYDFSITKNNTNDRTEMDFEVSDSDHATGIIKMGAEEHITFGRDDNNINYTNITDGDGQAYINLSRNENMSEIKMSTKKLTIQGAGTGTIATLNGDTIITVDSIRSLISESSSGYTPSLAPYITTTAYATELNTINGDNYITVYDAQTIIKSATIDKPSLSLGDYISFVDAGGEGRVFILSNNITYGTHSRFNDNLVVDGDLYIQGSEAINQADLDAYASKCSLSDFVTVRFNNSLTIDSAINVSTSDVRQPIFKVSNRNITVSGDSIIINKTAKYDIDLNITYISSSSSDRQHNVMVKLNDGTVLLKKGATTPGGGSGRYWNITGTKRGVLLNAGDVLEYSINTTSATTFTLPSLNKYYNNELTITESSCQ